jgi:hypothetical protein
VTRPLQTANSEVGADHYMAKQSTGRSGLTSRPLPEFRNCNQDVIEAGSAPKSNEAESGKIRTPSQQQLTLFFCEPSALRVGWFDVHW